MSRSRVPLILGLGAAGGVGYYLYQSGGNPKVAEKAFESDIHKASARVRGELPGRGKEAEKKAEELGQRAGAKFDSTVAAADKKYNEAKADAKSYAKEAQASAMKKVDEFDKKVEEGAAKTKSGLSSWFGGK